MELVHPKTTDHLLSGWGATHKLLQVLSLIDVWCKAEKADNGKKEGGKRTVKSTIVRSRDRVLRVNDGVGQNLEKNL